ncbi:hypothetical protein TRIUR3_01269 [Triticum urartu]|uniref:Uncharacterized protein n=1 Tax=Triticum urartu TaxID=4572 RepID=M7ZX97_TRIUA|nr:hypothetical protein TRIUR3_01269 [Triticum urartu]
MALPRRSHLFLVTVVLLLLSRLPRSSPTYIDVSPCPSPAARPLTPLWFPRSTVGSPSTSPAYDPRPSELYDPRPRFPTPRGLPRSSLLSGAVSPSAAPPLRRGAGAFAVYSRGQVNPVDSFHRYGKGSLGRNDSFATYQALGNVGTASFNSYTAGATGGAGKFAEYDGETNTVAVTFANYDVAGNGRSRDFSAYTQDANSGVESFTGYGRTANSVGESFNSYGNHTNSIMSAFINYGDKANSATDTFDSYGLNGNTPQNTFRSYSSGSNGGADDFKGYRDNANVGDDSFTAYANDANGATADFQSYGKSVNPGSVGFKGYGQGANPNHRIGFTRYTGDNTTFKAYSNEGVEFKEYQNMSRMEVSKVAANLSLSSSGNHRPPPKWSPEPGKGGGAAGGHTTRSVSCHQSMFPYLVYYCHSVPSVRVYEAEILAVETGRKINRGVAICHLDTSDWSPGHGAFAALGGKPGEMEVCHWIFQGDMVWTVAD